MRKIRNHGATAPRTLLQPVALSLALLCFGLTAPAHAQDRLEILPPVPEVGGEFGRAIALDADRLVVGSPGASNGEVADSGAVWVYERRGARWVELQRLAAPTPVEGRSFGYSVALNGDLLVVGASSVGTVTPPGAAYVYRQVDGAWELEQQLAGPDPTHRFGRAVAVGPNTIVVSDTLVNDEDGEVYVYERQDGVWTEVAALTELAAVPLRLFGNALDLAGDTIAVGVNASNSYQGRAVTYRRSAEGTWEHSQTFSAQSASNQFGRSVSLSGDTLAIAASHDLAGRIFLYERGDDGLYARTQIVQYQENPTYRGGGVAMDLDGDTLWAGLWRSFSSSDQGGAFSLQRRDGTWEFAQDAFSLDPLQRDRFGWSVAIDGSTAVIGAWLDDREASNAGAIVLLGDAGTLVPALRLLPLETTVVTTGVPQQFVFETFGGLAPTQLEPLSGDVPVAGVLDPTTNLLAGDALAPGTYTFTATAVDAEGAREEQEFTVQVLGRPTVQTSDLPPAVAARPFVAQLAAQTELGAITWTLEDGELPQGLTFDGSTGTVQGTPATTGVFPLRFTADDERGGSSDVAELDLRVGEVVDLSGRRHTERVTAFSAPIERTLELVRGTRLSVSLANRGRKGAAIELRDNAGNALDLGRALQVSRIRRFEVPATGRYFLRLTPAAGTSEKLGVRVTVRGPKRVTGTTSVDPDGNGVVSFSALPGARVKLTVQPDKGSAAVPSIEFVVDPRMGGLVSTQDVQAQGRGAVARFVVPLRGGGDLSAGLRAQGVTSGPVRWKASIRSPATYTFVLPGVASGD